jgi:hypothetical protein
MGIGLLRFLAAELGCGVCIAGGGDETVTTAGHGGDVARFAPVVLELDAQAPDVLID